jgi:hypothetical protein
MDKTIATYFGASRNPVAEALDNLNRITVYAGHTLDGRIRDCGLWLWPDCTDAYDAASGGSIGEGWGEVWHRPAKLADIARLVCDQDGNDLRPLVAAYVAHHERAERATISYGPSPAEL